MILLDFSVVIDVLSRDPIWYVRSLSAIDRAAATDQIAVNDIVYAELSPGYDSVDALDAVLSALALIHAKLPKPALFVAGQAFQLYRQRRGPRTTILPDFLIGAHALVENAPLLTRDPERVRAYFPTVMLISP